MFQSCAAAGAANTPPATGLAAMEMNAVRYRINQDSQAKSEPVMRDEVLDS